VHDEQILEQRPLPQRDTASFNARETSVHTSIPPIQYPSNDRNAPVTRTPAVLYETINCLALDKPAGILTMGDRTGEPTLVDFARDYLRDKYSKPGNVFVGVVHRIDRPVSGVVLFSRTSKGASRLSEQFPHSRHYKIVPRSGRRERHDGSR